MTDPNVDAVEDEAVGRVKKDDVIDCRLEQLVGRAPGQNVASTGEDCMLSQLIKLDSAPKVELPIISVMTSTNGIRLDKHRRSKSESPGCTPLTSFES